MRGLANWWQRPTILVALAMIGIALVLFWPYLAYHSPADTPDPEVALLEPGNSQEEFLFSPENNAPAILPTSIALSEPVSVVAYISGAVAQPDVYTLPADARVKDLVMAAGGFIPEADSEQINLAAPVQDAQHIHVPRVGELSGPTVGKNADVSVDGVTQLAGGMINLNTASQAELEELSGIGQALAQRIIDYRTTNGPFTSIDDLQEVTGIGSTLVASIRDQVTVGN